MKCAKCGNEISPEELNCPYCSGEKTSPENTGGEGRSVTSHSANSNNDSRMMLFCPSCGSRHIRIEHGDYSFGWGCLGLLLFSWIGLLLGLLGLGDSKAVCQNCGYSTPLNRSQASCSGCGCLVIIIFIVLLITLL